MKRRCLDPSRPDFRYYGALGVQVCPQWLAKPGGFEQFLEDLGKRPHGFTLDCINPYGHYEPENCRWKESLENSASNRYASSYHEQYRDEEDEDPFKIQPKWPELVVEVFQPVSADNADIPF